MAKSWETGLVLHVALHTKFAERVHLPYENSAKVLIRIDILIVWF